MGSDTTKVGIGKLLFAFLYVLVFPAAILWLSGDWFWVEGWIFGTWFLVLCYSTIIYLYFKNPALLAERYRKPGTGGQKGWDKYVVYGLIFGFTVWILVIPFDAKRYGWTPSFPVWVETFGGVLLALSFFFFFRSYADNSYLSPLVRLQTERKQQVVSTGVYGFVRHPMYLGATCLFFGTPVLLGSIAGIAIGFLLVLLLAWRIVGEEKMLAGELEGYDEYRKKVRYRLLPFIW